MPEVTVVIPSRNGREILTEFLPGILEEARRAAGEVILVDDCSDDGTADLVAARYPSVRLLSREGDPGFCHAVNMGMGAADSDSLLLLNNDTVPREGSFSALLADLWSSPEEVAAVVPRIPRPDGTDDGDFRWGFRRGLAVTGEGIEGEPYPSGACSLWRRKAWEELGGLDTRYAPIYWEDADLGARMHRAGYRMKRCTDVTVEHRHAATMGGGSASDTLRERNRFVFMDANCSTAVMRLSRAIWLPFHLTRARLCGNMPFTDGYSQYRRLRKSP
ncbi:MAG: glycosyltransferase [Candidatus Fermentibacteraceae bacterium]|nr:glycosyltransferase [Candidatus Fermentibacteraceae bacterium]MBN2608478.1 glycosyltransferase [Candidatus Fermentibacteraceae bacterium]